MHSWDASKCYQPTSGFSLTATPFIISVHSVRCYNFFYSTAAGLLLTNCVIYVSLTTSIKPLQRPRRVNGFDVDVLRSMCANASSSAGNLWTSEQQNQQGNPCISNSIRCSRWRRFINAAYWSHSAQCEYVRNIRWKLIRMHLRWKSYFKFDHYKLQLTITYRRRQLLRFLDATGINILALHCTVVGEMSGSLSAAAPLKNIKSYSLYTNPSIFLCLLSMSRQW